MKKITTVEVEQRGKSSVIKDNQYSKLEAEYNKAVAQMFGAAAPVKAPAPVQGNAHAASPDKQTPPASPPTNNQQPNVITPASEYWVRSVKPSGKESQLLELINAGGEVVSAYIKNSDKAVKAGSRLTDVNMVQKQSSYGQYNLINGYQIAA